MNWLGLEDAAKLLRIHPVTLKRKAAKGEIPGRKPGQEWVFLEEHLAEWMKGGYALSPQGLQGGDKEIKQCRSTNVKVPTSIGLVSPSTVDEYRKVLGLTTGTRRRSSTTS